MQLFTDNSTATSETKSDSIIYGMLIILLTITLLYISQYIYVLGPLSSSHSLLFPNSTSTSTKQHESVLPSLSFSRSDSLITWPNTPPRQSAYSSSRSPSDTLDKWLETPLNDTTFPLPHLSQRSPPNSPTRQASRAPMNNIEAAAKPRPSRRSLKKCTGEQNLKRQAKMSDFICPKRDNKFPF